MAPGSVATGTASATVPRGLLHGRHGELGAGTDTGGPAPGHGLHPGEETHPIRAVHVQRAEHRALPAAEAMEGHRHRNRHVDANHADLDVLLELPRGIAV